jgi:hypothetical protein
MRKMSGVCLLFTPIWGKCPGLKVTNTEFICSALSSLEERSYTRSSHVVIVNNDNDVGEKREERGQRRKPKTSVVLSSNNNH